MSFANDEYGKRVIDFVTQLQKLTDYEQICKLITTELEWFGLTFFTSFTMPGPGDEVKDGILFNNRTPEYTRRYYEKNYIAYDPAITELRRNLNPYTWSDIRSTRKLGKPERLILDEAIEFGSNEGLVVPIVTLSGSMDLFCPCGLDPDLSQRARAALEMIGIYSQNALKRALMKRHRRQLNYKPLSDREREVIRWMAVGKTNSEIADILSVGTSTVDTHWKRIQIKLDASRRSYAVIQALRAGEISL